MYLQGSNKLHIRILSIGLFTKIEKGRLKVEILTISY